MPGVFDGVCCILNLHKRSRQGGSAPDRWALNERRIQYEGNKPYPESKRKNMKIGLIEILLILMIIYYAVIINRLFRKGKYKEERVASNDKQPKEQPIIIQEENEKDPYKILNIDKCSTKKELALAYRKMVKMYHPDKIAGLAPEYREIAEKKMKIINSAYIKLQDTITN
ncbi:MAG: J domain-containing protein [Anaerolineales bacterium]|nr:J domain-containing protein [Anaerolineales bacterium]